MSISDRDRGVAGGKAWQERLSQAADTSTTSTTPAEALAEVVVNLAAARTRRACCLAWAHLVASRLDGELSRRVLDGIAASGAL